jgi:hypothetical protein
MTARKHIDEQLSKHGSLFELSTDTMTAYDWLRSATAKFTKPIFYSAARVTFDSVGCETRASLSEGDFVGASVVLGGIFAEYSNRTRYYSA